MLEAAHHIQLISVANHSSKTKHSLETVIGKLVFWQPIAASAALYATEWKIFVAKQNLHLLTTSKIYRINNAHTLMNVSFIHNSTSSTGCSIKTSVSYFHHFSLKCSSIAMKFLANVLHRTNFKNN